MLPCLWKHHFTPGILLSNQQPRLSQVAFEIPAQPLFLRWCGCILHACPCKNNYKLYIHDISLPHGTFKSLFFPPKNWSFLLGITPEIWINPLSVDLLTSAKETFKVKAHFFETDSFEKKTKKSNSIKILILWKLNNI